MKLFKPNIQRLAKKKNVRALIKVLKDSGWDTSILLAAVSALGEMSDLQAVEALKDSDSGVRQAAAATLGQLGYTRAVEPLLVALEDNGSRVREQAAAALVSLGWRPVDETQSALLAVAQRDWDRAVSLGSAAVEPLVTAIRDNNSQVRVQAAEALGRLGDPRAVEPLIEVLKDIGSAVSQAAFRALRRIGDPRGVDAIKDYQHATEDKLLDTNKQQSIIGNYRSGFFHSTALLDETFDREEREILDDITRGAEMTTPLCRKCAKALTTDEKFCSQCGTPFITIQRGERRLC